MEENSCITLEKNGEIHFVALVFSKKRICKRKGKKDEEAVARFPTMSHTYSQ